MLHWLRRWRRPAGRSHTRLQLECLEGRLVPSTTPASASPPGQGNAGPQSTAPTTLPDATSGQEYQSPGVGSGGSVFSAAGLPSGLRMDPFTGAVLGTPAEQGPFNFTVRITSPDNITST